MGQVRATFERAVDDPCQRAHAALRSGERPGGALAEHVAACPACAALVAGGPPLAQALDDVAAAAAEPGVEALLAEVEASIGRERGPAAWLRSRSTPLRVGLGAVGAGLVPLLVWLAWRRVDASVYPSARLWLDVALALLPAALVLAVAMRPLHRSPWPRWVEPLGLGLAVLAVLVGPALGPAHLDHPASLGGTGAQLVPRAMVCLAYGVVLGLPALAWLGALRRGGERSVLLGVTAGLVGGLAIFLHCSIVAPAHLLLGHATVLLPLGGLALLVRGPRR